MKRVETFVKIFILCVLLFAMGLALRISSWKVRVIFAGMTLAVAAFALACRFGKPEKPLEKVKSLKSAGLTALVLLFVGLNLYYNAKNLAVVLPLAKTQNQMIYQEEYAKDLVCADSYIRELIRNKTVVIPNEPKNFDFYNKNGDEEERQEKFPNRYYKENNFALYFKTFSRSCRVDESMPNIDGMTAFVEGTNDSYKEAFENMGIANDMLRYSFLLNEESIKESSYFWYSWFYYTFSVEKGWYPEIFVQRGPCEESDTLAAVWDKRGNLYLMPLAYYEETIGSR